MRSTKTLQLTIACTIFVILALVPSLSVELDRVVDGDTVRLRMFGVSFPFRFHNIDAPELSQSYGYRARDTLSELIDGRPLTVKFMGLDPHNRPLGVLFVDGINVDHLMVSTGNAWEYEEYSRDSALSALQSSAKANNIGLWAFRSPIYPPDYRRSRR